VTPARERVAALDAFRGFTMICMVSSGFGLLQLKDVAWIAPIAHQFDHEPWEGLRFWDLIQPFFMFIVGAVMPWSFERRWQRGETWNQSARHVARRSGLLIVWGLVARSIRAGRPILDLINVLAQIAFTYPVAFLTLNRGIPVQLGVAFALLAVHTIAYVAYGNPWTIGENLGESLDRAVLGKNWGGHYATINCVSSAANTLFGVVAGELIRRGEPRKLAALGGVLLTAGLALSPWIPIIKKIWTASFALTSGGITVLVLLLFWWLFEERRWSVPVLGLVGANSIFIYLFHEILGPWLTQTAKVFTGWGTSYWPAPLLAFNDLVVVIFQIWVCVWLYRRQIFFKL
jgi:predicted acyltransferase